MDQERAYEMTTKDERAYIAELMREFRRDFDEYAKEYQQERDLGALAEFVELYRKARKLKTLMWPGENSHPAHAWREDLRTIVKEVVSHGLLLLTDLDKANGSFGKWKAAQEEEDLDEEEEPLTGQGEKAKRWSRAEAARLRRTSRNIARAEEPQ